ncbi:flagellar biosynthesis repressor FlbT [Desertibaculum subflavum]|uniref:flagellar biosynthesis repressor FlbT n=1 Tax=Desertibaculum subflavum TaxID=2268458 RepID=UPI000E670A66
MPLRIALKAGEKIIVNGAVLQAGDAPATLLVHNAAALLREREIMTEERAVSPATRVYYTVQCAYLFPSKKDLYLQHFYGFLEEFVSAAPSAEPLARKIRAEVEGERYYPALRSARKLIEREQEIMNAFGGQRLQPSAPGGQPAEHRGLGPDGGRPAHAGRQERRR